MSLSERIGAILHRAALVTFLLAALALVWWLGQSIAGNFARQALIEDEDFGALREVLDEDFSGEEIETDAGTILVYNYSKDQNLDELEYDQVSDLTLLDPATGRQRKLADDDRRVIWFKTIEGSDVRTVDARASEGERGKPRAFAYVARLASREMYKKGISDLVVGNFRRLEQREIAKNVPYVDSVSKVPGQDQVALVYWDSPSTARFAVISADTLEVVRTDEVALPEAASFNLDQELDQAIARDEAIERATQAAARGPKPKPRVGGH